MFTTLLIAGEDKGQMRPGLAAAVAAGEEIVVIKSRQPTPIRAIAVAMPEVSSLDVIPAALPETVVYVPAAAMEEVRPQPVFTLSALPTVTRDAPQLVASAAPLSGDVWYVTANSVNVRQGPSTDTSVVEKLTRGEAVSVAFEEGSEWARVTIQGDGVEGYVALRLLSPTAP